MRWRMGFIVEGYEAAPAHLNVQLPKQPHSGVLRGLDGEADERQSAVGSKANKQGLWLARDTRPRQVIAFHSGDRRQASSCALWPKIPLIYRAPATCWTDAYQAYQGVIPEAQHKAISQKARKTNRIERLNCALRQQLSRLVRAALSFSKKPENYIGAIRYFLSNYNLELVGA